MANKIELIHVFVDHSNVWGAAQLASRIRDPSRADHSARVSVKNLDLAIGGKRRGVTTKIASGGIPPGMEPLWAQYQQCGYDTQRLFRDEHWKERGVDHSIIGHMWRLLALHPNAPGVMVLVSGDGRKNEFGTSFLEVVEEVLGHEEYATWRVELASFHWGSSDSRFRSPTNSRLLRVVEQSPRGTFVNLMDHYNKVVYHEK